MVPTARLPPTGYCRPTTNLVCLFVFCLFVSLFALVDSYNSTYFMFKVTVFAKQITCFVENLA